VLKTFAKNTLRSAEGGGTGQDWGWGEGEEGQRVEKGGGGGWVACSSEVLLPNAPYCTSVALVES
jgi:hypothetical protein